MKRLTPMDAGFLAMETREMPMHVGGLNLYEYPDGADASFVRGLLDEAMQVTDFRRPFGQRLKYPYGKLGPAFWKDDEHMDIEYHVRHSALPAPGRYRELFSLVSHLHTSLLDRTRPLWEMHLIEGLENNRFATYTKMHHSMIDGIAGMRLLQSVLSEDPNAQGMRPPFAAVAEKKTGTRVSQGGINTMAAMLQKQFGAIPNVTKNLTRLIRATAETTDLIGVRQAPRSILNGRIWAPRRFVAQSYSLDRIRTVAKAYDATINDVVLAMSSGALRRHLLNANALPDKPLISVVPVSVRSSAQGDLGNSVAAILVNLGTNLPTAKDRMVAIQKSVAEAKQMMSSMSNSEILLLTMLTSTPGALMSRVGIADRFPPNFNLAISNVPGPKQPLYWNGARLAGMYPVSIPMQGAAMNITVTSYVDSLDFGITACRRSVPQTQRMIDYLELSLHELETDAGIS